MQQRIKVSRDGRRRPKRTCVVAAVVCCVQLLIGILLGLQQSGSLSALGVVVLVAAPFVIVFTLSKEMIQRRGYIDEDSDATKDLELNPGDTNKDAADREDMRSLELTSRDNPESIDQAVNDAIHPQKDSKDDGQDEQDAMPTPLTILAEATLVEGLRSILAHHLRRSVGTNVVCLSSSQADLMEHHLSRLASYAQKIVHTLSFATRFFAQSQQHMFDADGAFAGEEASGLDKGPLVQAGDRGAEVGMHTDPSQKPATQRHRPKKRLKLDDEELLKLYFSAQSEAQAEADWRGILGPVRPPASSQKDPRIIMQPSPGEGSDQKEAVARTHEDLKLLGIALLEGDHLNAEGPAARVVVGHDVWHSPCADHVSKTLKPLVCQ